MISVGEAIQRASKRGCAGRVALRRAGSGVHTLSHQGGARESMHLRVAEGG